MWASVCAPLQPNLSPSLHVSSLSELSMKLERLGQFKHAIQYFGLVVDFLLAPLRSRNTLAEAGRLGYLDHVEDK